MGPGKSRSVPSTLHTCCIDMDWSLVPSSHSDEGSGHH